LPDIEDKTHFRGRSKSGHADSETGGHAHSEMTGHLPEMGGHDGLKYAEYLPTAAQMPISSDITPQGLVINTLLISPSNGLANIAVYVPASAPTNFSFSIPGRVSEMISSSTAMPVDAKLPGGLPLPNWLSFDPDTLTFNAVSPAPVASKFISVQVSSGRNLATIDITLPSNATTDLTPKI
jgi:hypothetical protein